MKGLNGLNLVNSVILEQRSLFDAVRRDMLEALVDPFLIHHSSPSTRRARATALLPRCTRSTLSDWGLERSERNA